MNAREAEEFIRKFENAKTFGDYDGYMSVVASRAFLEATKAAEPLLAEIEKQDEMLKRIDNAAMVYAYKSPEEGFDEILVTISASIHQRCVEALSSSAQAVKEYKEKGLGEI